MSTTTLPDTTTAPPTDLRFPSGIYKGTREEWLEEAMNIMAPWLNTVLAGPRLNAAGIIISKKAKPLSIGQTRAMSANGPTIKPKPADFKCRPKEIRGSCSLLSAGMSHGPAIAHVHLKPFTGNNFHEIRMGAHLGGRKTRESSSRVADILLHEMIHTMFPYDGHKIGFRWVCEAIGLQSPMTSTTASPALKERITHNVVKVLGRYPHKGVKLVPRGKRGKGSRLLRFQCTECECIIRLTQIWVDKAEGVIRCPIGPCNHIMEG